MHNYRSGKKCYIPRYFKDPQKPMEMVHLKDMDDYDNLPLTKWNIKQPPEDEDRALAENLDLILIPGLAFSPDGKRLGRGKGYYDNYLKGMIGAKTVALAFKEQVLEDVPVGENDVIIHKVLYQQ